MPEEHSSWVDHIQGYNFFYNEKNTAEDKNRTKSLKITQKNKSII